MYVKPNGRTEIRVDAPVCDLATLILSQRANGAHYEGISESVAGFIRAAALEIRRANGNDLAFFDERTACLYLETVRDRRRDRVGNNPAIRVE